MITEKKLPCLFFIKEKTLSPIIGDLGTMPIKVARLGLLNPVTPEKKNYLISQRVSAELIRAVMGGAALYNSDQLRTVGEERSDRHKDREVAN